MADSTMEELKGREEMVVIEINFGSQKDEVKVHFGDDPFELARVFTSRHCLKEKYIKAVAQHIQQAIDEFKKSSSEVQHQEPLDESALDDLGGGFGEVTGELMMPPAEPEGEIHDYEDTEEEEEDAEPDEFAEEAAQENIFNKLKEQWGARTAAAAAAAVEGETKKELTVKRQMTVSRTTAGSSSSAHTKSTAQGRWVSPSKSVNERLYRSADWRRKKREDSIKQHANEVEKAIAEQQHKISAKSNQLAKHRQGRFVGVGDRLYHNGIKDKERKIKLEQKGHSPSSRAHDWSCALCGKYHSVPGLVAIKPNFVCAECGWNQGDGMPFKPVNIGLELMPDDLAANFHLQAKGVEKIHDELHADWKTQKVKRVQHLRKHRQEESKHIPFAPTIPEVSEEIIRRQKKLTAAARGDAELMRSRSQLGPDVDGLSGRAMAIGKYLQKPASDRLYKTNLTWVPGGETKRKNTKGDEKPNVPVVTEKYMGEFVNRLVYEYEDKETRKDLARADFYSYDHKSNQPLFQPRLNPFARLDLVTGQSDLPGFKPTLSGLLERCQRTTEQRDRDVAEFLEWEKMERKANRATALPQSEKILEDSLHNSIKEMFRLLAATERVKLRRGASNLSNDDHLLTPQVLTNLAQEITDLDACVLNVNAMEEAIMVPELGEVLALVKVIRAEERRRNEGEENTGVTNTVEESAVDNISYSVFYRLVRKVLKMREGGGKTYMYVPRKQPVVTRAMIEKEVENMTFNPKIPEGSESWASRRRRDPGVDIADSLMAKAEKTKARLHDIRRQEAAEAKNEFSFRPTTFKNPKHVQPRYRQPGTRTNRPGNRSPPVATKESGNSETRAGMPQEPSAAKGLGKSPPKSLEFESFTPFSKHVMQSSASERASPSSSYSSNIFYHPDMPPPSIEDSDGAGDTYAAETAVSPTQATKLNFDEERVDKAITEQDQNENSSPIEKIDRKAPRSVHLIISDEGDVITPPGTGANKSTRLPKSNDPVPTTSSPSKAGDEKSSPWYEDGQWHTTANIMGAVLSLSDSDDED